MADTVAIQVPAGLYRRLERLADLTHRPLESLIEQTLSANLPPLPDDLPDRVRDALVTLEGLSDDDLWQIMHSVLSEEQHAQFVALREKVRAGTLTEPEHAVLDALREEADLVMLRKAYAALLLKWRGHRLPTLAELEAGS